MKKRQSLNRKISRDEFTLWIIQYVYTPPPPQKKKKKETILIYTSTKFPSENAKRNCFPSFEGSPGSTEVMAKLPLT